MSHRPAKPDLPGTVATAVGIAVVLSAALGLPSAHARQIAPRSAPVTTPTAYAVIGTLSTGSSQAAHIAILNADDADLTDDTLYVAAGNDVLVFRPGATTGASGSGLGINQTIDALGVGDPGVYVAYGVGNTLARYSTSAFGVSAALSTVSLPESASSLAVGGAGTLTQADDSVYAVFYNNVTDIYSFSPALASSSSLGIPLSNPQPSEVTVGGGTTTSTTDDTVYVVGNGYGAGTLVQAPPNLATQSSLRPGYGLVGAAVFDDSLIIGPASAPMLALRTANWDDSVVLGAKGADVSVSRQGVIASYEIYTPTLSFVDVRTGALDDTVGTSVAMFSSRDVAFAGDGVAYATAFSNSVALIDKITAATLGVGTALVGSSVRVSLTLQSGRLMDDSTVTALWLGDDTIPVTRVPGQNAVEFAAPSRIGTMAVAVELRGGNSISAGSLTITTPPPPPPTPASAPAAPVAKAGDASASVSWSAPTSSGSFPVSHYQVASSPGGRMCLVAAPSLSCEVMGLTNGTTYTFTVKALTGAGWSASSEPSNAVTPRAVSRPTIVIAGSREGVRIAVAGRTTGMGMGGLVTPWTSRSLEDFISRAAIPVSIDATFTWSRRAANSAVWRVYFTAEGARSNTVTIR